MFLVVCMARRAARTGDVDPGRTTAAVTPRVHSICTAVPCGVVVVTSRTTFIQSTPASSLSDRTTAAAVAPAAGAVLRRAVLGSAAASARARPDDHGKWPYTKSLSGGAAATSGAA